MIQTKAILIKFIFYFSLFVCVVIGGCRNDDDLEGCGCNSETITTIQESASLTGEMYYKSSQYSLDEYSNIVQWKDSTRDDVYKVMNRRFSDWLRRPLASITKQDCLNRFQDIKLAIKRNNRQKITIFIR